MNTAYFLEFSLFYLIILALNLTRCSYSVSSSRKASSSQQKIPHLLNTKGFKTFRRKKLVLENAPDLMVIVTVQQRLGTDLFTDGSGRLLRLLLMNSPGRAWQGT